MNENKQYFINEVTKIKDCIDHSGDAPHIASVTFRGVRSEVLLHALEQKKVYVSSGSACSSNKPELSGTLLNMGLSKDDAESTLRFSLSVFTTRQELDYTLDVLREVLPTLRRFTRR
jgi:cysteine desulfurase